MRAPREYLGEIQNLQEDLAARLFAPLPAECRRLYELGRVLDLLSDLVHEKLSLETAREALAHRPSAGHIVGQLVTLGAEIGPALRREAELCDDRCVPPALAFYRNCTAFAKALVEKLLASMSAVKTEAAILLCGGFYGLEVSRQLARREALCSILIPHFMGERRSKDAEWAHPSKFRSQTSSFLGDVSIHTIGGGVRTQIQRFRKRRLNEEPDRDSDWDLPGASREKPDSAQWVGRERRRVLLGEMLREASGEVLHECRICKRHAALEERPVICLQGHLPDLVLPCVRCERKSGRFLCAQCAGREPIGVLPGHGVGQADGEAPRAEILVCNLHGVVLGESGEQPRILSGGLPGHSF